MVLAGRYARSVSDSPSTDGALEQALDSVDPQTRERLEEMLADSAYVMPRVVSHLRD